MKSKKRKYNWIQIALYFCIICLEEAIIFIKSKNNKLKLVKISWIIVNLYGMAILISQPFCMWNGAVLNSALWAYVVAAVVSFGLCPKESLQYLFNEILTAGNENKKEEKVEYNHGYEYNVINIQDYIETYSEDSADQERIAK